MKKRRNYALHSDHNNPLPGFFKSSSSSRIRTRQSLSRSQHFFFRFQDLRARPLEIKMRQRAFRCFHFLKLWVLAILNWGEVIEFKLFDIRKNIKERGVSLRHCHRTITLPCSTLCPSFKYFVINLGELAQNVARSSLLALLVKSPLKRVLALHSDLFLRLMIIFVTSQHFTMVFVCWNTILDKELSALLCRPNASRFQTTFEVPPPELLWNILHCSRRLIVVTVA